MTTDPRETTCPYCGQPVAGNATRCRWCQADLRGAGEVPLPPDDLVVRAPGAAYGPRHRWRVPLALALAAFLAVVLARVLWVERLDAEAVDVSLRSHDGTAALVTSEGAKRAGLAAASEAAQQVLSFSGSTFDADLARVRPRLSGDQRRRYDATMAAIRDRAIADDVTVQATVVAASVLTATPDDVEALLFVNQVTTESGGSAAVREQDRVLITLHRDGGRWLVTDLTGL